MAPISKISWTQPLLSSSTLLIYVNAIITFHWSSRCTPGPSLFFYSCNSQSNLCKVQIKEYNFLKTFLLQSEQPTNLTGLWGPSKSCCTCLLFLISLHSFPCSLSSNHCDAFCPTNIGSLFLPQAIPPITYSLALESSSRSSCAFFFLSFRW